MKVLDVNLLREFALPAAGASAASDSIDFGAEGPGPLGRNLELHVVVPALPNLADGVSATFTLQESSDDSAFTDLLTLDAATVTGASGSGSEKKSFRLYLPPETKQFVRLQASVGASGGDNTASSVRLEPRV